MQNIDNSGTAPPREEIVEKKDLTNDQLVRLSVMYFVFAATAIIVSLAWRDSFTSIINYFFPKHRDTLVTTIVYAIIVTVIAVIVVVLFARYAKQHSLPVKKIIAG